MTWDSDAFSDPYRRFTKYLKPKSGTSSVDFIDMADFKPSDWDETDLSTRYSISPLAKPVNCWGILKYEGYTIGDIEAAYPKKHWERDRVVCVG